MLSCGRHSVSIDDDANSLVVFVDFSRDYFPEIRIRATGQHSDIEIDYLTKSVEGGLKPATVTARWRHNSVYFVLQSGDLVVAELDQGYAKSVRASLVPTSMYDEGSCVDASKSDGLLAILSRMQKK